MRCSSTDFLTPPQVHDGEHLEILKSRTQVCESAKAQRLERGISDITRGWTLSTGTWTTPPWDTTPPKEEILPEKSA